VNLKKINRVASIFTRIQPAKLVEATLSKKPLIDFSPVQSISFHKPGKIVPIVPDMEIILV
jgi:hypothetical protein